MQQFQMPWGIHDDFLILRAAHLTLSGLHLQLTRWIKRLSRHLTIRPLGH